MIVTVFKNIWDVSEPMYIDVLAVFKRIKDGGSMELINQIRQEKDEEAQDNLKKRLPSILFSGRFSQRKAEYFLEHSGLICLDVDSIEDKDMDWISDILKDDHFTFGSFISPRGQGFKVIIKIAPDRQNHRGLFQALEKHFNSLLYKFTSTKKNEKDIKGKIVKIDETQGDFLRAHIDQSGKDISRVCFESFDPKMYYNPDSDIWIEILEESISETSITDVNKILELLQIWIDRQETYVKGNRNRFLSKFTYAACRYSVPAHIMREYLEERYPDFPNGELKNMVKSAYKTEIFGSQKFTKQELETKSAVVKVSEPNQITQFWTINDKGRVKIDTKKLLHFIEAYGYGIYRQKEDVKSWDFVLIKNMIVDIVDVLDIKKDVLDYVEKHAPDPVFDELQMRNRYFEKTFLNALKVVKVQQIKDTKDTCYIFFDGFYYEITAQTLKKCDYIDLKGVHIWRSQLCKETITEIVDHAKHDFDLFIQNAMGDQDNYVSACTALGYGIHTYKKQRLAKLIYACDANEGELDGLMSGGSGKNLYQKALGYVRSVVEIDGKDFDKRDKFKFQTIKDDTQIVIIDDFESDVKELFTKITGGFSVEKKSLHKKVINFEDSPKIFVSSNSAPKGFSDSYARRLHILEFSSYYNHGHTPTDDFGEKDFFSDDWNQKDYNCLYSFLFNCVQIYLKNGIKDLEYKDLKVKQLIKNVGRDFAEYWLAEDAPNLDEFCYGRELKDDYCASIQKEITDQSFYRKMRMICKINSWEYESKGVGALRRIKITK